MRTRIKSGARACSLLLIVLMLISAFIPATTVSAKDCEEWWTKRGLVDKAGDNENGYTIGSRGDTSFTVCRYEKQLDLLASEFQFAFQAWPTNGKQDDQWAYINFDLDFNDSTFLRKREENAVTGRVQICLNQHKDGTFTFWVYDNGLRTLFKRKNFDFDAVHSISFEEKAMGIFLVFDGVPWLGYDFTPIFEKHIGENAGKTYFAVGGNEGYEFTNLKILPKEKKEVSVEDFVAPDNGGGKLGDLETEAPVEEIDEGFQLSPVLIAIGISVVTLIAAIIITSYVIRKKKGKKTKEQEGGTENENI